MMWRSRTRPLTPVAQRRTATRPRTRRRRRPPTPQPLQYTVPAPPPGHVAIPGLDLVDDTRPGMPRFGYASGAPLPDAPPEFIRDADDI